MKERKHSSEVKAMLADLSRLAHEQDQDEMNAKTWWAKNSDKNKAKAWAEIQAACNHDSVCIQIVGRFAQLGFTAVAIKALTDKQAHGRRERGECERCGGVLDFVTCAKCEGAKQMDADITPELVRARLGQLMVEKLRLVAEFDKLHSLCGHPDATKESIRKYGGGSAILRNCPDCSLEWLEDAGEAAA